VTAAPMRRGTNSERDVNDLVRKDEAPTGLAKLREPFPANQISKLPKPTKSQNECPAAEKVNCNICGGWHHPRVVHLDYVGHAALTDRLLDADPMWYWEPLAFDETGLPRFDATGGLWIRLHVCGHSRLGYGHAQGASFKEIGSREKEVIGDALRNAAMRFGAALDLWHKGDLHVDAEEPKQSKKITPAQGAWEGLDEQDRDALSKVANTVMEYMEADDAKGAYDYLDRQGLDAERKIALWTRFDSKTRRLLKEAQAKAA
jgi:hypothetical protein